MLDGCHAHLNYMVGLFAVDWHAQGAWVHSGASLQILSVKLGASLCRYAELESRLRRYMSFTPLVKTVTQLCNAKNKCEAPLLFMALTPLKGIKTASGVCITIF